MQPPRQLLVVVAFIALSLVGVRRANAECEVLCPYVCCNAGQTCSADGYWCLGGGGGGGCTGSQVMCPNGNCYPEGSTCCANGTACGPGDKCDDVSGFCVEDDQAPLPPCSGDFPVECGNGNCCGVSFPVCCPFTCCPLGTACSADGFSCVGEPSITCAADKKLTLVDCEDESAYCECASTCSDNSDCATGCCRGGVCTHPCLCAEDAGSSTVNANATAAMCPAPSLTGSRTGGLGRGGCAVADHSTASALLAALGVILFRSRRHRVRP